jgi:hypothetical protein
MGRRVGWLLSVAVASMAGSMWATSSQVGAASTLPASQLESLALHNAEDSGWVHEVTTASGQGHTFKMVNDIGTTEGRQVITSDGAHGIVLVIGGIAYLYGDKKAIANYFGLSSTDPGQYANRWIEIPPANPDFRQSVRPSPWRRISVARL